ncbi:LuxR C-terminal-related transcriptional regulator, partial [Echinicola pacifica]|uniref:LuxR C-terminal-related transcriptional regulator n=1 Tax=Echinicola pacifica TaxID=346377 RepID=UPI00167AFDD0
MSQIKQMIILNRQGKGVKTIARMLDISKNTVKTYLFKLDKLLTANRSEKLTTETLLSLDEPELHTLFHPGNPSYKDSRYEYFKANLGYYLKELEKTGVTRVVLWEEYRQAIPDGYSYSQFCFHLDQQQAAKGKP